MKYFTKEMWLGFQKPSNTQSIKHWDRKFAAYRRQLSRVVKKLKPQAKKFFTEINLHDGHLYSFAIKQDEIHSGDYPCYVELHVLDCFGIDHRLQYGAVRRIETLFPSDQPLFHSEGRGFEDWGYDELTSRKDFLRHEILFSSGATILIEFKEFTHRKTGKPAKRSRRIKA